MFCPECGTEISDTSKFCIKCGHRIEGETKKETTPVNNDRPSPNKVTSQKIPESPLSKIKNPVMIVLIIIICVSLLYFIFSSRGSNKLTSPVETVVQTPPVNTVETPEQDVSGDDGWEELIRYPDSVIFCKKKGNIEKDGNTIVQVWTKNVWTDKGRKERLDRIKNWSSYTEKDDKTLYTLDLVEIDCKNWKIRVLSMNDYDKDGNITRDLGNILDWTGLNEEGKLLRLKFCQ